MAADDTDPPAAEEPRSVSEQVSANEAAVSGLTGEFYRGEVDRMSSWRTRLDQTTNWAVVVVAAILTWAFSSPDRPHYVVLIGMFAVVAFLAMEATRYREYDIWRARVRTLQTNLLAPLFGSSDTPAPDWEPEFGEGLRNPSFTMSYRQALTHRLRRAYIHLLLILLAAWVARVALLEPAEPWQVTASVHGVPGTVVVGAVGVVYALAIAITLWSARGARIREFQE